MDKSREEFETWAGLQHLCTDKSPSGYTYISTETTWQAWQSSRDSLVIELPSSGYGWDDDYQSVAANVHRSVILYLRSKGLTVE